MAERMNGHRLEIDDPDWDPRDKLAYLHDLHGRGIDAMRENRGRLLDFQGEDRSDLIPQPPADGDLSPMLGEVMEMTARRLEMLIEEVQAQADREIECVERTRASRNCPFP
ncbi:MAG: hypothetical protein PHU04_05260 [Candidatus Peribacteraceae bacterium]|nr:hypothetical protein [Candidatus Peribacteraceae bacterium]